MRLVWFLLFGNELYENVYDHHMFLMEKFIWFWDW